MQGTGLQVIPRGALVSSTLGMVSSGLTTKIDYPPVDGLARVFHSTNALNLELLRSTVAHTFMALLPLDVHTVQPLFLLISIGVIQPCCQSQMHSMVIIVSILLLLFSKLSPHFFLCLCENT